MSTDYHDDRYSEQDFADMRQARWSDRTLRPFPSSALNVAADPQNAPDNETAHRSGDCHCEFCDPPIHPSDPRFARVLAKVIAAEERGGAA